MIKYCLLFFVVLISCLSLNAQLILPEPILSKYENGVLKVKWEPQSIAEWQQAMKSGYVVEITEVGGSTNSQMVKASSYEEIEKKLNAVPLHIAPFYEGTLRLMFPEKITDENEKIEKQFAGEVRAGIDSLRLGYVIYCGIYDFELARMSGLAASFKVSQGKEYKISVRTPGHDAITKNVHAVLNDPKVPELKGVWGDREVEMEWRTFDTRKQFFGYMVDRSEDGLKFKSTDNIPYVNIHDKTNEDGSSVNCNFKMTDSLEYNDKLYYYRLRGFDFFGEASSSFKMLVGQGYDKVTMSPFITYADQTEDNRAHIKWNIAPKESRKVHHFEVFRADTLGGKYERVVDFIEPTAREVHIQMKHTSNYFRIEAHASQGKGMSSNPILVMGQDTVPPKKPIVIGAFLDSLNRAVVTWRANKETDLWGYRIFKSNFKSDEYTLMNAYPTLDTVMIDNVDIRLGTKDIFYLVEAADKRNNRSPLSDTIRIELPDVLPPASPIIVKVEQQQDTVQVHINKSPSEDVVIHSIFRRDVSKEGWIKLIELDNNANLKMFSDLTAEIGVHYAYTITAKDKSGNESEPEFYREIIKKKVEKPFVAFEKIDQKIDQEKKTVTIQWTGSTEKPLKSVLVYKGTDKDRLAKYKYVDAPDFSLTDALSEKKGEIMYYRLKPVYENQDKAYFSDVITVEQPIVETKK